MKNKNIIMDFSGIYREEQFWKGEEICWVDVRDIPGTNCYCDGEAFAVLLERIADFSQEGIHFIDSGNYHYMSRIWLEKIREPFNLLVFDNHTDMQLPAFGGLLSCGGWIAAALMELENLKHVILVGPDEEAFSQVEPDFKERVTFLSREELKDGRDFCEVLEDRSVLPLYISIDKDVLCKEAACTAWSQGDMTLKELLGYLEQAFSRIKAQGGQLLGVDVCGECSPEEAAGNERNDSANRELLEFLKSCWQTESVQEEGSRT